jgi:two-component system sensor histidine kinase BaeS
MWTLVCTMLDAFEATLSAMSSKPFLQPSARSRAPGAATSPWRRLDSLRVKLFVGIAGVNALVVLLAYLVNGWSFNQGLSAYMQRAEESRLAPLVERLTREHGEHGNWTWLVNDHEAWHRLMREELGLPSSATPRREPDPSAERHHEGRGGGGEGKLMLLDANREAQIGPQEHVGDALLLPIPAQGPVLGYLARPARRELFESLEDAVAAQQGRQFAIVALGMLAAVLLNAALIARWLARRLALVSAGAAAVAQGNYEMRLSAQGHDELARLSDDFNRMAGSLQASQQARQRWIADIAHELRTPLAGLQAEIEALQDGVRQPTPERLDSLAQQVRRLTRLVEDLRLLSLSDLGALDYRTHPLDLGQLVESFMHHPPVPCGELQLRLDLGAGLRVQADAARLQQVLGNLLQNTLRYCDAPATLKVSLSREGREAHLRWEDSPPGVPPQDLSRLTERLYRADLSRSRASGGSGLGLAIVRAIVEGHGGRLSAGASTLGGLAWDIRLPLLDGDGHD